MEKLASLSPRQNLDDGCMEVPTRWACARSGDVVAQVRWAQPLSGTDHRFSLATVIAFSVCGTLSAPMQRPEPRKMVAPAVAAVTALLDFSTVPPVASTSFPGRYVSGTDVVRRGLHRDSNVLDGHSSCNAGTNADILLEVHPRRHHALRAPASATFGPEKP